MPTDLRILLWIWQLESKHLFRSMASVQRNAFDLVCQDKCLYEEPYILDISDSTDYSVYQEYMATYQETVISIEYFKSQYS